MSNTVTATGFNAQTFAEFLADRDEPAWLSDQRKQAWELFESQAMPTQRDEEWMRTDIRLFRLDRYPLVSEQLAATPPTGVLTEGGVTLAGSVCSLNSHGGASRLDDALAAQGVLFGPLDTLLRSHGDLLKPHLQRRITDPAYDRFAALNAACWSGGVVLYVPRGVTIEQPLHAIAAIGGGGVDLGRILVILEADAEATLICETASLEQDGDGLHCGSIELMVGPQARLRYVNLQNWGNRVWHFAHQRAVLAQDARLQWTIGALGSRLAKVNQHVTLSGAGAEAQVNGVMFTEGRQHLSYHTLQHHEAPHCRSDLLYKAALQDTARTVWRGMIKVDPAGQKTDAYQRNDNLMLSATARADSIPGLEIEADDVRCTHGSTSGRVDEEQIFYCRNRGLTRHEAIRMIVTGFFQQVFDRVTIESVREALGLAIRRRVREYE